MKKPRTPYFVIFGAMRTGSNLLERTLEALGDTVCYGEAFNPAFIGGPNGHSLFGLTPMCRDEDPRGFLTMLRMEAGKNIPGFRFFEGHAPELAPLMLADPDCRRIILRRDPLASYLSLKTAQETGQWLLRNAHRRQPARVRFDPTEFLEYREKLTLHYAWLESEMHAAGTDAMRLDYEDLQSQAVLLRVADFIGSKGEIPLEQPIVRQNPGPLSDRVINYEEMCDWLGVHPEPRTPPPLPEAADILICRKAPLAVAPIDGPGGTATLSLLYRLDHRCYGGASLSHGQLLDPQARQQVFASGFSSEVLRDMLDERALIGLVCHPATRMHSLFLEELFGKGWHVSMVRRHLMAKFGGIPSPKEMSAGTRSVESSRHHAMFLEFLTIVAEAARGQGQIPPERRWFSQAALLARIREIAHVDRIGLMEDMDYFAATLARDIGHAPLPSAHVHMVVEKSVRKDLPMDEVMSPEVQALLRRTYAQDFAHFGYGDWPVARAAA